MEQFISLRTQSRRGEIIVNVDEISSCHIEGGLVIQTIYSSLKMAKDTI